MNRNYYMQRLDVPSDSEIDIEANFPGLIVLKVEGMSDRGEVKNIYTETYAEADALRVYIPQKVARKSTEIVMTILFKGSDRRDQYDSFVDWVSGHRIKYRATERDREAEIFQQKPIEIEDDKLIGDIPYLVASIKFTNIHGYTTKTAKQK